MRKLFLVMNPFTAAVAGGAFTVGNKKPGRSTAQKGECGSHGKESDDNEEKRHRHETQDGTGREKTDKRDKDCVVL